MSELDKDIITTTNPWWNCGSYITTTVDSDTIGDNWEWEKIRGSVSRIIEPKKGDDDMRYLYEVILVNPKNDTYYTNRVIARSETSALMKTYNESHFSIENDVLFDDLKTSCRILMEWKKEKSLKKAIETIKKAVE